MIMMKGWFSDIENILEIHQKVNRITCQQDPDTRIETVNSEKREHFNQIETQSISNRKTTPPNTELTQEEKINVKTIKKKMSEKKSHYHLSEMKTGKQLR